MWSVWVEHCDVQFVDPTTSAGLSVRKSFLNRSTMKVTWKSKVESVQSEVQHISPCSDPVCVTFVHALL